MFIFISVGINGCLGVGYGWGGGCGGIPPCPAWENRSWWWLRFKEPRKVDMNHMRACSRRPRAFTGICLLPRPRPFNTVDAILLQHHIARRFFIRTLRYDASHSALAVLAANPAEATALQLRGASVATQRAIESSRCCLQCTHTTQEVESHNDHLPLHELPLTPSTLDRSTVQYSNRHFDA